MMMLTACLHSLPFHFSVKKKKKEEECKSFNQNNSFTSTFGTTFLKYEKKKTADYISVDKNTK